jgi:hypothetical protein
MKFSSIGRGDARDRHRRQDIEDFLAQARAVHPRGLQDLDGDFAEIGVEHPDDDRQVDQHQHDHQAEAGVQQAEAE